MTVLKVWQQDFIGSIGTQPIIVAPYLQYTADVTSILHTFLAIKYMSLCKLCLALETQPITCSRVFYYITETTTVSSLVSMQATLSFN